MLGATFDPFFGHAIGAAPDIVQARQWHEKAAEFGFGGSPQNDSRGWQLASEWIELHRHSVKQGEVHYCRVKPSKHVSRSRACMVDLKRLEPS